MKTKKFFIDASLNIFSSALPLLILQLISLPIVASKLGGAEYGLIITMISLITLVSFPMGNVLNNVRLLIDKDYKRESYNGDFNFLLSGSSVVSIIVISLATYYVDQGVKGSSLLLIILITIFSLWREYLIVSFRLKLNFRKVLINNFFMSIGYLMGTLLFMVFEYWQFIYLFGLIFSLVFIFCNSDLHKESFKLTSYFRKTASKSLLLYIASLIKNVTTYADKLILLPLLGPVSVSIYYTATILGKIISMMITPVNSVILSYLVKVNTISLKEFTKALFFASTLGIIGYIFTVAISPYFFDFFYKEWAAESLELIYITTGSSIISVLSTVIHPFNLRFNSISWQMYMNAFHLLVYIIAVFSLFNAYGLVGFSAGVLVANVFKLLVQIFVFFLNYLKK